MAMRALVVALIIYLIGGVSTSLLQQLVSYAGAGSPSTLLAVFPMYVGSLLVYFLPVEGRSSLRGLCGHINITSVSIAALDLSAMATSTVGLLLAGSGIAVIIQASTVVITGVLSVLILKKPMSISQWTGVAVAFIGLTLTALGNSGSSNVPKSQVARVLGPLMSFVSAICMALEAIAVDALLSPTGKNKKGKAKPQMSAVDLCVITGIVGVFMLSVYYTFFVLPQWQSLVVDPLKVPGSRAFMLYVALCFSCAATAHGYFAINDVAGAVVTGLAFPMRAVIVFLSSSVLYCDMDSAQCFNKQKGLAVAVIVTGLLIFVKGSSEKSSARVQPVVSGKSTATTAQAKARNVAN